MSSISNRFNLTDAHFVLTPDEFWYEAGEPRSLENVVKPSYIIDGLTQDRYLNESKSTIRFKCALITFANPLFHLPSALLMTIDLLRRSIFSAFSLHFENDLAKYEITKEEISENLSRIMHLPLVLVGLVLSPIYGLYDPYNGRKLYASCERYFYHASIVATCFQPSKDKSENYERVKHQTCLFTP